MTPCLEARPRLIPPPELLFELMSLGFAIQTIAHRAVAGRKPMMHFDCARPTRS
jgi:hypothetical protein